MVQWSLIVGYVQVERHIELDQAHKQVRQISCILSTKTEQTK